jgi:hypothetical protein
MPVRTSLAGRWSTALAMALLGLAPFVVLSTAAFLQAAAQSDDLHTSRSALQMVTSSRTVPTPSAWSRRPISPDGFPPDGCT